MHIGLTSDKLILAPYKDKGVLVLERYHYSPREEVYFDSW